MKASQDRDLYCMWSTVVDNVTYIWTREEVLAAQPRDRVDRADKFGSSVILKSENAESVYTSREGGCDHTGFIVTNIEGSPHPFYWLKRSDLAAYLDALLTDDDEAMYTVLAVIEDDEDSTTEASRGA